MAAPATLAEALPIIETAQDSNRRLLAENDELKKQIDAIRRSHAYMVQVGISEATEKYRDDVKKLTRQVHIAQRRERTAWDYVSDVREFLSSLPTIDRVEA